MRQAILFAVVGILNTGIDVLVYLLLTRIFGVAPVEANATGFLVGSLNSYLVNGLMTFRVSPSRLLRVAPIFRFVFVTAVVLTISTITIKALLLILPDLAAKAISVLVTFGFGFLLSRALVYSSKK